ncbi:hypothetical protein [Sphingobacterium mizutaii]|uniref:hypothetical protein n=1 Tax=Sphingobacterium mizutaii TaxID=1010 RepID=UPI00289C78E9|nr:hypothetical protein [Sphingobacterium mizutaii]
MKKKQFKLSEVITLTVGAIMFIIGISSLIYVYNDILPQSSKLPVSIWGTVSDWVIVFITIVTAVLLLLTLKSQKEVQADQAKINKLGMYDIRCKHSARFDMMITDFVNYEELSLIKIFVSNAMALDVTISMDVDHEIPTFRDVKKEVHSKIFDSYIQAIPKDCEFIIKIDNEIAKKTIELIKNYELIIPSDFHPFCNINIFYKDNSGFDYIKRFRLMVDPQRRRINVDKTNDMYL